MLDEGLSKDGEAIRGDSFLMVHKRALKGFNIRFFNDFAQIHLVEQLIML